MKTKKIAILQSCYIPWKGYFDLINQVDEFILYDTVQYTKNDWRNRNIIKTNLGTQWLTIPIKTSGNFGQKICEVEVSNKFWIKKHINAFRTYYGQATYFKKYFPLFEEAYCTCNNIENLSMINHLFIMLINKILDIQTTVKWSSEYSILEKNDKTLKLIEICKAADATHYVSGPSAMNYINEEKFFDSKIQVSYIDYSGYPRYKQLHNQTTDNFIHTVSVIDLILNEGENSKKYIKSFLEKTNSS